MKLFSVSDAAREAECSAHTIRRYADQGLVDCTRLPDGTRIFDEAAVAKARKLKAANMRRRVA